MNELRSNKTVVKLLQTFGLVDTETIKHVASAAAINKEQST